jgi:hypothetical protein
MREDTKYQILLWGHGSRSDYKDYQDIVEDVNGEIQNIFSIFDDQKTIILTPVLPRYNNHKNNSKMDPQILSQEVMLDNFPGSDDFCWRPDVEIVKMIDLLKKTLHDKKYQYKDALQIGGVSAGGQMANRFSLLYPNLIEKVVLLVAGDFIYPVNQYEGAILNYPFGINDINKIKSNQFDLKVFQKIPHYIYVGEEDMNDPIGYETNGDNQLTEMYKKVLGVNPVERTKKYASYLQTILGMNIKLKIGAGLRHRITEERIRDVYRFL